MLVMLRIIRVLFSCLLFLSGCVTYRTDNRERLQAFPQKYAQFDAKLAWEVTSTEDTTVIDGFVQNIRYHMMDDLEIWVWVIGSQKKAAQRASAFIYSLRENEIAQFRLGLPRVASGTRLQFLYRYAGNDGGGESGVAARWSQSFESEVP
jgi:hypothetical protein